MDWDDKAMYPDPYDPQPGYFRYGKYGWTWYDTPENEEDDE